MDPEIGLHEETRESQNERGTLDQLKWFLVGGGITLGAKFFLTAALTEIFLIPYFLSYVIILLTLILFSFAYNISITFRAKVSFRNFTLYAIFTLLFHFLDGLLVRLLTEKIELFYLYSIGIVTGVLFITKFIVYKNFVLIPNVDTTHDK